MQPTVDEAKKEYEANKDEEPATTLGSSITLPPAEEGAPHGDDMEMKDAEEVVTTAETAKGDVEMEDAPKADNDEVEKKQGELEAEKIVDDDEKMPPSDDGSAVPTAGKSCKVPPAQPHTPSLNELDQITRVIKPTDAPPSGAQGGILHPSGRELKVEDAFWNCCVVRQPLLILITFIRVFEIGIHVPVVIPRC